MLQSNSSYKQFLREKIWANPDRAKNSWKLQKRVSFKHSEAYLACGLQVRMAGTGLEEGSHRSSDTRLPLLSSSHTADSI
ncbi:hypothetical protein E2C01_015706 [Portunus trituberculatus]|uniref:Uncharacterized protein n=1 Tax=Portunus trituberculatus TaxID=210409 RepID=A0A5B7DNB9_PORTR|nr:hypothetical protein [Portunus trituberculatus]